MVPGNNDFRTEKFSLSVVSNAISADIRASKQTVEKLAKESALKSVLEKKGLKSVKTYDQETIVSYEGMIITPISLSISAYDEARSGYNYSAQIQFAPIAFPDKWENLKIKYRIKKIIIDFFSLFK